VESSFQSLDERRWQNMAYRTPELVLIGAAQNLVLDVESLQEQCRYDNVIDLSHVPELW
jgi:hypothetical protein